MAHTCTFDLALWLAGTITRSNTIVNEEIVVFISDIVSNIQLGYYMYISWKTLLKKNRIYDVTSNAILVPNWTLDSMIARKMLEREKGGWMMHWWCIFKHFVFILVFVFVFLTESWLRPLRLPAQPVWPSHTNWTILTIFYYCWPYLTIFAIFDICWRCLTIFNHVWAHLTMFDHFWQFWTVLTILTISDHVWLLFFTILTFFLPCLTILTEVIGGVKTWRRGEHQEEYRFLGVLIWPFLPLYTIF